MKLSSGDPAVRFPSCPRVADPRDEWIAALLKCANPYCDKEERERVIRAVHAATQGSDVGLAMVEAWHRSREDCPVPDGLDATWRSMKPDGDRADGFERLCDFVESYAFDALEICAGTEPQFEPCDFTVVSDRETLSMADRYSLTNRREEVERTAVEQVHVLGKLALAGQLTAIYGQPSIGKSLITMFLIGEAIEQCHIDPSKCFLLDFDTDSNGILQKIDFAQPLGLHVLSDGYLGFSSQQFLLELEELILSEQALGVVVILDTIKQHVSLMDKERSSAFASRLRRFSKAGGTCIALGHVNKHPGPDGRMRHAGTTDVVEQFDAVYILSEAYVDRQTQTRTVLFEGIKSRGPIAKRASYRYSVAEDLTYRELLESVTPVDEAELSHMQLAARVRTDAVLIDAITGCIAEGIVGKMELLAAGVDRSHASKRKVLDVLDRYTGTDRLTHRWSYTVHNRGEKRYALLKGKPSD